MLLLFFRPFHPTQDFTDFALPSTKYWNTQAQMEDAQARKERLRALKEAAAAAGGAGGGEDAPSGVQLKFRNYAVKDEKHIQHEKVTVLPPHYVRSGRAGGRSDQVTSMSPCDTQVAAAQPPKFDEPVIEKKAEELVAQQVHFVAVVNASPNRQWLLSA